MLNGMVSKPSSFSVVIFFSKLLLISSEAAIYLGQVKVSCFIYFLFFGSVALGFISNQALYMSQMLKIM